jgi:hypothetical protein
MRLRNRNWPTEQAATLNLSSDAFAALSLDEMTALGQRCVDMKVRIGSMRNQRRVRWDVGVSAWAQRGQGYDPKYHTDHTGYGNLAIVLTEALDKHEREHAFTPDELVTIANQSGMAVTRG